MRPILSENPMWEAFGTRALAYTGYGGADIGECLSTVQRVGDEGSVDDWYREWMATGERVAGYAEASAADGHIISAREAWFRASSYFRVAWMPLFGAPVDERLVNAFEQESLVFRKAADLADPPLEPLEIPFEGRTLPGYFARVDTSGQPRPTIIHTNGYDGTLHEMYFAHVPAAIRRGYNVLIFDGPGQGRNLIHDGIHMRPNWETVVSPVIDFAIEKPEVDPNRVILAGWSFGGLLAPRAAGCDHRLAALIADPGQWDLREGALARLPLDDDDKVRFPDIEPALLEPMEAWLKGPDADPMMRWQLLQRGPWVHGVDSLYEYLREIVSYTVSDVAAEITCPVGITAAEGDPLAQAAQALYNAVGSDHKTLIRFTEEEGAAGHCEALARSLYHQRVFDWLDDTLGHHRPSRPL